MQEKKKGTLYVVATPIGNLQDISLRALEVLKSVELIAAEDTRKTGLLLKHFGIEKSMISFHDHNEKEKIQVLLERLANGQSVALVSDAGTPLISDPGYQLVKAAKQAYAIVPIPGACAAITALSGAGLPAQDFSFHGFLPNKSLAREKCLRALSDASSTQIFYETPHRLLAALESIRHVFGERQIVVAKELTKIHEAFIRGSTSEVIEFFAANPSKVKGEMVILIAGVEKQQEMAFDQQAAKILTVLMSELSPTQAMHLTSKITGIGKNALYKIALNQS